MNIHYLDNSATTMLCEEAKQAILSAMDNNFGNPSSLHALGVTAEQAISEARAKIIYAMGVKAKPEQIIFTSGGTEAANLALIGFATAKPRNKGKKIIIGESEHDCVLQAAAYLEQLGFKVIKIPSPNGIWDIKAYEKALGSDVILVSAMLVNNETGAVNDINTIASMARAASPNVVIHTDAVQGFLKLDKPLSTLDADMISISGHKIGAPKGVGALYVREEILKSKSLVPIVFGGGQENGYRSGTENTLGIIGFGAAAKSHAQNLKQNQLKIASLRALLGSKLLGVSGVRMNIPQTSEIAKHIVNLTVFGIKSETLLHHLSGHGIYVSSGSACSSNTGHISHSLKSFGLSDEDIGSSIRVSFCETNTDDDVNAFIDALFEGIAKLAKIKVRK